jgi:acetyltransferase-like isoleucine patch superfamily enzyme
MKHIFKKNQSLYRLTLFIYNFFYHLVIDIKSGRVRGVLFLSIGNILPDLYSLAFLRTFFWSLAGCKIGDYSSTIIRAGCFVESPKNLHIGERFHINRGSYIDATGGCFIGSDVTISLDCKLLTLAHAGSHHEREVIQQIRIGDHAIIYAGAIILPGTIIEKYVQVAAGAVLKGTTIPGGLYAGIPATFKGYRKDIEHSLFE